MSRYRRRALVIHDPVTGELRPLPDVSDAAPEAPRGAIAAPSGRTARRDFISGLPPEVPAELHHLLLWLDAGPVPTLDNPTPGLGDLARVLHESVSTVRRAVEFGRRAGILTGADIYNRAGNRVVVSWHTIGDDAFRGKVVGRMVLPNWSVIKKLQKSSMFPLNITEENQCALPERTAVCQGGVQEGRIGLEPFAQGEPASTAIPNGVLILAWRELEKRFRESQALQGKPPEEQKSLVHGKYDTRTLRQIIQETPARGSWPSYIRVVNLFSFWIEHHPLRHLNTAMGAFKGNRLEWMQHLTDWEDTEGAKQLIEWTNRQPQQEDRSIQYFRALNVPEIGEEISAEELRTDLEARKLIDMTFKDSGYRPVKITVATALRSYSCEEIEKAWSFFVDKPGSAFSDVGVEHAKNFWNGGGLGVYLNSYKNQEEKKRVEGVLKQWLLDLEQHLSDSDCGRSWASQNAPKKFDEIFDSVRKTAIESAKKMIANERARRTSVESNVVETQE